MIITTENHFYTPEEYLELEEIADYKSEYLDGEIISMTGGTTEHNEIALNFCTQFKVTLKGQGYKTFMGDVRLWIPQYRLYTYPDVMVVQGQPIYDGDNRTTITNPMLIIEVLSKSTSSYDRGDKFTYYRSIPEFKEYILIDQYQFHLEQFIKQSQGQWLFKEYDGEQSMLVLESIDFQISCQDIYEGVALFS